MILAYVLGIGATNYRHIDLLVIRLSRITRMTGMRAYPEGVRSRLEGIMETPAGSDWVATIGSWLDHGPSGLALGLFVGALLALACTRFNKVTVDALKVSLRYGLLFLFVAALVTIIPLFVNPTLKVNVIVKPDVSDFDPLAVPKIYSSLTKSTGSGIVEVTQRDGNNWVKVDVGDLVKEIKDNKIKLAALSEKLDTLQSTDAIRSSSYAIIAPTTKEAKVAVEQVATASNPAAASEAAIRSCTSGNAEVCGWAHLARGDIAAAQSSFASAVMDTSLSPALRASAHNGLGYTYLTQGKTAEAVDQIRQSSDLGNHVAKLQLDAIQSQSDEMPASVPNTAPAPAAAPAEPRPQPLPKSQQPAGHK